MIIICIFRVLRQILGTNRIFLVGIILITSCNEQSSRSETAYRAAVTAGRSSHDKKILSTECNLESDKCAILIYNNTSSDSVIGEPHDSYQGYIKAKSWSNDGPYPPKFFDLKIVNIPSCDSFKVEMNIANSSKEKNLLSKNAFIFKGKATNNKLIRNVPFEKFYNNFYNLKEIRFYFYTYHGNRKCYFLKKFELHESEEIVKD